MKLPSGVEPRSGGSKIETGDHAGIPTKLARAFVLAASLSTAVLSILIGHVERFRAGSGDELIYRFLSRNLIEHHYFGYAPGQSVAYRPPGYPFFNAGVRLLNDSQASVRVAQALLAGCTVWLAAWTARRLFGETAAVVTAVLLVAVGTFAAYASLELSETLATATLVAAVAAALTAVDRRSWRWAAASGALLGASALTRPQGLLLVAPLALCVALAAGPGSWRKRVTVGGAIAVALIATILPWTIRNAVRVHAFVPVAEYGGEAFFLANNAKATGVFLRTTAVAPDDYARIIALPEGKQQPEWFRLALRFIRQHPSRAFHNWLRDARIFVTTRDDLVGQNSVLRNGHQLPIFDDRWLWPAAGLGVIIVATRRRIRSLIPAVVVVYSVLCFMVFLPQPRFRHGVIPFLAVYAAAAAAIPAAWIAGRLRESRGTGGAASGTAESPAIVEPPLGEGVVAAGEVVET